MPRSKFVRSVRVTKAARQFEAWLIENSYQPASEMYPGAVEASTLVYDYLNEFPERGFDELVLATHAKEIGWVSAYSAPDGEDDEEPDEIDPEADWS